MPCLWVDFDPFVRRNAYTIVVLTDSHMVTGVDIGVLAGLAVAVLVFGWLLRLVRPLLVNTVLGLGAILAAGFVGVNVAISGFALALVVLGGLPGALVVILLSALDIAFVPVATLLPVAL
jgi:hypothetical protein